MVLVVKILPAYAGIGFNAESGRCPGGGHGNPLQCSCLENSIDRGSVHKVAESDTTHAGKVQGYV